MKRFFDLKPVQAGEVQDLRLAMHNLKALLEGNVIYSLSRFLLQTDRIQDMPTHYAKMVEALMIAKNYVEECGEFYPTLLAETPNMDKVDEATRVLIYNIARQIGDPEAEKFLLENHKVIIERMLNAPELIAECYNCLDLSDKAMPQGGMSDQEMLSWCNSFNDFYISYFQPQGSYISDYSRGDGASSLDEDMTTDNDTSASNSPSYSPR